MRFTDFFIRRATTTTLLIAAIAGFGLLSYFSLPVSNLPEVEYPTIRVQAALPGANPDAMASTVATPLESEFSTIPGIEHMTSTSRVGETNITLQFDLNRGIDAAAQDVQAAISRAAGALPASMPSPPSYSKVNPAQSPILWLEMSSTTMALDDFAKYANQVFAKRVSMVSGVSQVEVYGPEAPAIRVEADPARLAAYGLDLEQIRTALTSNSANLPSGTLYGDNKDFSLQANSQLSSAGEFSQMVVAYRDGSPIRLNQVANVFNSSRNDRSRFWINGRRSVILAVRKQPGANTVEVADKVKAVIQSLHDSMPPGVSFGKVADDADLVRESIAEVNRTLVITICLVMLVIFLFLGTASSTIVASATIPVSILGSFIVMQLLGYSVDMFSMMAITLSVGFIVDDAIVMIENIVRHREMGKTRMRAALDGANEVGFTIISMTISLVAVFLPIVFLNGILGRLLREFAVTISVSILLSGVTALTLTPMLCSRFLGSREIAGNWFQRRSESFYATMQEAYRRSLDVVLRHRRTTIFVSIAMTAGTIYLFIVVPKSFLPAVDVPYFSGTLEASQDNSFEHMVAYGEQVNKILATIPWMQSNLSGVDSQNNGWFWVNLVTDRHRPNVKIIMADLQKRLNNIPGLNVYLRQGDFVDLGQSEGRSQYSAALESPDAEELYRWAPRLKAKLQSLPELANVSIDLQMSAPRVNVNIRRDLAMSLDVDPEKIANTLYDAYGNREHHHGGFRTLRRHPGGRERVSVGPGCAGRPIYSLEYRTPRSSVGSYHDDADSGAVDRQPHRPISRGHFPIRSQARSLAQRRDRDRAPGSRGDWHAGNHQLRISRDRRPVPKLAQRPRAPARHRSDGDLSCSRSALRELHPSHHNPLRAAIGCHRRSVDPIRMRRRPQSLLIPRHNSLDRHREKERDHDRRFRARCRTRLRPKPRGRGLPGLPATLSSNHDDYDGRVARGVPGRLRQRSRRRGTPPPRYRGRWRPPAFPIADPLHHAGHLSLPSSFSTWPSPCRC